jgi:hypothetical protein
LVNHIDPLTQCLVEKMFPEVPFYLDILSTNMRIANGSMQISMERNICGKQYIVRCVVNGSRRKTFK